MTTQSFTRNYRDHSNDAGFQFEFSCDKCGNGHRSSFARSHVGLASSVLKAAGSLFGGAVWQAGRSADYLKDALRGPAWDGAFKNAIEECRPQFRQCTLCGKWVCPEVCWNHERGLCESCAPDLHENIPAIQAKAAVEQARKGVDETDQLHGADLKAPMRAPATVGCHQCKAPLVAGAKFCASCGTPAMPEPPPGNAFCAGCGQALTPGARFCGGCGLRCTA